VWRRFWWAAEPSSCGLRRDGLLMRHEQAQRLGPPLTANHSGGGVLQARGLEARTDKGAPSNKRMKLRADGPSGASQLVRGVIRTCWAMTDVDLAK
jgi:hypothetical protein